MLYFHQFCLTLLSEKGESYITNANKVLYKALYKTPLTRKIRLKCTPFQLCSQIFASRKYDNVETAQQFFLSKQLNSRQWLSYNINTLINLAFIYKICMLLFDKFLPSFFNYIQTNIMSKRELPNTHWNRNGQTTDAQQLAI